MLLSFRRGLIGENITTHIFENAGYKVTKNTDKDKLSFYDLECFDSNINFTIEVKYDYLADEKGNVAIEIFNSYRNKSSGLTVTQANFWCHCLCNSVWITTVDSLKKYTKENKPFRIVNKAGDNNATILLYKIVDILPAIFVRIDNLSHKDLRKYIYEEKTRR